MSCEAECVTCVSKRTQLPSAPATTSGMGMPKRASRQRGRIEERGPGVFLVRVFRGKDATGKKKYIARTIRGRKSDAKATLTEMLRGGDTRSLAAPGRRS